jgi:anaerobic ribonucleoside-triphosphate reductase activating protein
MMIRLNKAHFPVTVLGPGRRIGIWTQGCSIQCKGCVSRDTWEADDTKFLSVDELISWCRKVSNGLLDGVTITGGEPFEQPEALEALVDGLISWRAELEKPLDILCYSGFAFKKLQKHWRHLLEKIDALIPEPFVGSLPGPIQWRGSVNQPLVILSELGRVRYEPTDTSSNASAERFQTFVDSENIWCIGIPKRGDMQRFELLCQQSGLALGRVSWRS